MGSEMCIRDRLCSFINKILPSGCQWLPDDPLKTQRYYELVLIDSGSIELYHIMDKSNPEKISYSKCIIKKVIRPTKWASLTTTKEFTINYIPKGYSYHDYKMAWIGHSYTDHSTTIGSLPFIPIAKQSSPYGSMNGGIHTDLLQTFYHRQLIEAEPAQKIRDYRT